MKFPNQYISKFTDSFLKKQDKFQALKELGNKKSIPHQLEKTKNKLTEEYKFWMNKKDNPVKTSKLAAIERDIKQIKRLESMQTYGVADIKLFSDIVAKYGL
jgi:hypothetical protein